MKHRVTLLEDDDYDLDDDIAPEFDLESMERATEQERKYRAQASGYLVRIAPDVAKVFATPESVNGALRALIRLMGK
jgi:hypothetical protein